MDWSYITAPLIGGVIGYFTNYIAVKMLFRPLKPLVIKGKTVPFSQGLIPKSQSRLAKAVGDAVGHNLITNDAVEKTLLSDEMKDKIRTSISDMIQKNSENEKTIKECLTSVIEEQTLDTQLEKLESFLTEKIHSKVISMEAGKIVADEVVKAITEKMQGTFLAPMLNGSFMEGIKEKIKKSIDNYIAEKGEEVIGNMVSHEADDLINKPVGHLANNLDNWNTLICDTAIKAYEKIINEKLEQILSAIDISKIVEDKINSMDVMEMEKLVLQVMKKELDAIVNLGAVIGLVLGLVNLLFK